jgi:diguanylate cyclase (GGDEF)-like protein/PAS domain S-box-containing protein
MLISKMEDGLILDANEAFEHLVGHTRTEVLGQTTLQLGIWADPVERTKVINHMATFGRLREYDVLGKTKDGQIRNLIFSGETIYINGEYCLISILQDVTEKNISERMVKMRLDLWEYSATHTTIELMTKALDLIEDLTMSKVSFFHTVLDDGKTLPLQAWSTRTKKDYCKDEGENGHHGLEKAGIWGDCIREGRSIIHNDYAAVINKKGLPEGHAPLLRELTVPIYYKNKIEAVLGVGNKETNYLDSEIQIIENIANDVWTIIRQKQADDKIVLLNEKLESLAMTDELTKIANRRSFFIKGAEEIIRARRYHLPLSVIMLDIDRFKLINDTFSHDSGDLALQCVASTLMEGVREVDVVGRLGGEEFGIILPNTKLDDARGLAERLRVAITENSNFKCKLKMEITASFGVAEYHLQIKNLDELLKNADTAMYKAKNTGRNRVEYFTSEFA